MHSRALTSHIAGVNSLNTGLATGRRSLDHYDDDHGIS